MASNFINSYPCNDYRKLSGMDMNRITFAFCTGDDELPDHAEIFPSQADPVTGETVPLKVIREYNRLLNRQVDRNRRESVVPMTLQEERERRKQRAELADRLCRKYGRLPRKGILDEQMQIEHPREYVWSYERLVERGVRIPDPKAEEAYARAEQDPEETVEAFAAQFTGRLRAVAEMLIAKSRGEAVFGMRKALAEQWGVHQTMISQDIRVIGEAFLAWIRHE